MGILYADRIRLNIVAELHMREMGPKQFYEQVGGSSYETVRRHFKKLAEYGWLRHVRTEASGRGRPEDLYRTTEIAVIDDETWALIPTSIRDSFTVQNLLEMGELLEAALEAPDDRAEKRLALVHKPLRLDEVGWQQAVGAINACFRSLALEQTDAKIRLQRSRGEPILIMVELGGFEIETADGSEADRLPASSLAHEAPRWPRRISKLFSDPLNLRIINLLNERPMSPTELLKALGGVSLEGFDARCKSLEGLGWVTKVERPRGDGRGGKGVYYRATSPDASQASLFNDVPEMVRNNGDWQKFENFCQAALSSLKSGAFNRRADRHLTLSKLLVDEIGWNQIVKLLEAHSALLGRIEAEAAYRTNLAGPRRQSSINMACFLAGFSVPRGALRLNRENG